MNEIVASGIAPPPREHAEYNKLFEILVDSAPEGEGLIGFAAYAYYKIAKREYVDNFYKDNGRHPNEAEMRAYICSWTDSRIGGLKTEANALLSSYTSYVVEKERPKITEEALKDKSFLRDAFVAFCGALFYSIVLIIFAIVLKYLDIDIIHVFSSVK
jgi:hypothetical protein